MLYPFIETFSCRTIDFIIFLRRLVYLKRALPNQLMIAHAVVWGLVLSSYRLDFSSHWFSWCFLGFLAL